MGEVSSIWRSKREVKGLKLRAPGELDWERILSVEGGSVFVLLDKRVRGGYEKFVFMVGIDLIECMFMEGEFLEVFEEV